MTKVRRSWLLLFLWGALMSAEPAVSESQSPTLEPTLHSRAMERATRLPRLRSLLVSIDGKVVEERYFHGAKPSYWANLKSVSKSVLSMLVGIAIDQGYLKSVTDKIGKFFPEYLSQGDVHYFLDWISQNFLFEFLVLGQR